LELLLPLWQGDTYSDGVLIFTDLDGLAGPGLLDDVPEEAAELGDPGLVPLVP
jgi:hypothetical protein